MKSITQRDLTVHSSRDIDTGRVAFCETQNISTPNLSYAAQYLACALAYERFTSALEGQPVHHSGPVRFATPSP